MSFVSFSTDSNIMNQEQLNRLKENYANLIVDGMDMEMLCQLACDALSSTYDEYTVDQLIAEAEEYYPHLLETE